MREETLQGNSCPLNKISEKLYNKIFLKKCFLDFTLKWIPDYGPMGYVHVNRMRIGPT